MAGTTTAIIGSAMGAYQLYEGIKNKNEAKNALNNYERQELDNAFEDIQISTVGTDIMREESGRNLATAVDTISGAGDRAIIGGLPRVIATTNDLNRNIQKDIDDRIDRRSYAIAGDNRRVEGMIEARDNANINALNSQYQQGQANIMNGVMGIGSGLMAGAREIQRQRELNKLSGGTGDEDISGMGGMGGEVTVSDWETPDSGLPDAYRNQNLASVLAPPPSVMDADFRGQGFINRNLGYYGGIPEAEPWVNKDIFDEYNNDLLSKYYTYKPSF